MPKILSGKCLCERVKYEVADDFRYALVCHCSQCRRATGAANKPFAGIEAAKLAVTEGAVRYCGTAAAKITTCVAAFAAAFCTPSFKTAKRCTWPWGPCQKRPRFYLLHTSLSAPRPAGKSFLTRCRSMKRCSCECGGKMAPAHKAPPHAQASIAMAKLLHRREGCALREPAPEASYAKNPPRASGSPKHWRKKVLLTGCWCISSRLPSPRPSRLPVALAAPDGLVSLCCLANET